MPEDQDHEDEDQDHDDDQDYDYDPAAKPGFFAAEREDDVLQSEKLLEDGRRPVLYLRPFEQEGEVGVWESFNPYRPRTWRLVARPRGLGRSMRLGVNPFRLQSFEKLLKGACRDVGLVIGIGEPNERFAPAGLLTEYVGDDWKERVRQLIDASQLVIMRAGTSQGVMWEVDTITDGVDPESLLVFVGDGEEKQSTLDTILPIRMKSRRKRKSEREEFYVTFRENSRAFFPKELPETIGKTRIIGFDADWSPQLLSRKDSFSDPTSAQKAAAYMYSVIL